MLFKKKLAICIFSLENDWETSIQSLIGAITLKRSVFYGVVIVCKKSIPHTHIPIDLQYKIKLTYIPITKRENAIAIGIKKLFTNEDYITVFNNSYPFENWDVHFIYNVKKYANLMPTISK